MQASSSRCCGPAIRRGCGPQDPRPGAYLRAVELLRMCSNCLPEPAMTRVYDEPMCYSARIWADYRKYIKAFGAELSIKKFVQLFWERRHVDPKAKIPKALCGCLQRP